MAFLTYGVDLGVKSTPLQSNPFTGSTPTTAEITPEPWSIVVLTLTIPYLIQVYFTPNSSDHDNTIELLAPNDLFVQAKVTQPASLQTSVRDSIKIQNPAE